MPTSTANPPHHYYPLSRERLRFKQTEVAYDREPRLEGVTKASFRRTARRALDELLAFSDAPLRAITTAGACVSVMAMGGMGLAAVGWSRFGPDMIPLAWLGSGLTLLGGVQLISLGVVGRYVARIHRESRGRPMFLVRQRLGFQAYPRVVPNVLDFLPREATELQERATAQRLDPEWSDPLATPELRP